MAETEKSEALLEYENGYKAGYKEGYNAALAEIAKHMEADANAGTLRWPPSWWP